MAAPKEHTRSATKSVKGVIVRGIKTKGAAKNLVIYRLEKAGRIVSEEEADVEVSVGGGYLKFPSHAGKQKGRKIRVEIDYAGLAEQSLYQHSQTVASLAPAEVLRTLATDVSIDVSVLATRLGIPKSTLSRKLADNDYLNLSEGERVLGLVRLIGQVEAMVEGGNGATKFDGAKWFGRWLMQPLPAIGKAPIELLKTATGLQVIESQLQMMQSGSYA